MPLNKYNRGRKEGHGKLQGFFVRLQNHKNMCKKTYVFGINTIIF